MFKIKNYLSLIKFSHTIFAMPFAMIGFVLGYIFFQSNNLADSENYKSKINLLLKVEHSSWDVTYLIQVFLLVILCMITARSAAMAFNRYLDRSFDAKNPRTAIREIPAGIISAKNALSFTILCCIAFVVSCYFINNMVLCLSPIALFVILFYSYTKRFTALCHLVLGVGLSLAPIGAYLAVTATFSLLPVLFSLIVLFWVSGFDIIYALQDEGFDKENNLHSIPAMLGKKNALNVSRLLHVTCGCIVFFIGFYYHFHLLYNIGAAIFITMLYYQHSIVKPNDLSKVNIAFMTANGIASIVFAIFVIADLLTNN
ncbi:MAG: UbiA-like polyprenyltransferase [Chitinophagaceae bacterium]